MSKQNLHNEFYDFRDKVWRQFEDLVKEGCNIVGELPIKVGEYSLPPNGLRTGSVGLWDTTEILINGIAPNEDYCIFPTKENEKDIIVRTNRITVYIKKWCVVESEYIELELDVEPYILDLQGLSTYISGGFEAYNN